MLYISMQPQDLLHHVNNQLEIVVGAANLLSQERNPEKIKQYRDQITTTALNVSTILRAHCKPSAQTNEGPQLNLGMPFDCSTPKNLD